MTAKPGGGLAKRLMTAGVLLPTVLALVWIPPLAYGFIGLVALFAYLGSQEYSALVEKRGVSRASNLSPLICAGATTWGAFADICAAVWILFLGLALTALSSAPFRAERPFATLIGSAFGFVYMGWFPMHFVMLHQTVGAGAGLVMVVLIAVIFTDSGAYFVGKALGKHKLAPSISPNKTWEGAIGGFAVATVSLIALGAMQREYDWRIAPPWMLWQFAVVGGVLSIVAQLGDLFESHLKRKAGVKDSGTIFPGHGGILDRCDGFLFAAPVMYYMAVLLG